jgi:hypothetical protein
MESPLDGCSLPQLEPRPQAPSSCVTRPDGPPSNVCATRVCEVLDCIRLAGYHAVPVLTATTRVADVEVADCELLQDHLPSRLRPYAEVL